MLTASPTFDTNSAIEAPDFFSVDANNASPKVAEATRVFKQETANIMGWAQRARFDIMMTFDFPPEEINYVGSQPISISERSTGNTSYTENTRYMASLIDTTDYPIGIDVADLSAPPASHQAYSPIPDENKIIYFRWAPDITAYESNNHAWADTAIDVVSFEENAVRELLSV